VQALSSAWRCDELEDSDEDLDGNVVDRTAFREGG